MSGRFRLSRLVNCLFRPKPQNPPSRCIMYPLIASNALEQPTQQATMSHHTQMSITLGLATSRKDVERIGILLKPFNLSELVANSWRRVVVVDELKFLRWPAGVPRKASQHD
eukprot:scaffold7601_cov417-Prasinococcus_capsulatus_cf.AAC.10